MKKFYYSIFIVLTIWQVYAEDLNEWGPITNNFQMSIGLKGDANEIKTNQPCILVIRYKNVSTNEMFRVYEVNGTVYDPTYSFMIISPSGVDLSPDMSKVRAGDSGEDHIIPPAQTIKIEFKLSHFCKFDEIGTYKIVARKRRMWSVEKKQSFVVVSNPLYVSVVSDK